jgi:hypothetical protein
MFSSFLLVRLISYRWPASVNGNRREQYYWGMLLSGTTRYSFGFSTLIERYLCNKLFMPVVVSDVEAPTFCRKSAHRWRWGCRPYAPNGLFLQEDPRYSFCLRLGLPQGQGRIMSSHELHRLSTIRLITPMEMYHYFPLQGSMSHWGARWNIQDLNKQPWHVNGWLTISLAAIILMFLLDYDSKCAN